MLEQREATHGVDVDLIVEDHEQQQAVQKVQAVGHVSEQAHDAQHTPETVLGFDLWGRNKQPGTKPGCSQRPAIRLRAACP